MDADFARSLVDLVAGEPHLQLFQYEFVLESRRRPELREEAVNLYEGYIAALEDALGRRGHVHARPLARAVFAALDGLVLQQLTVADAGEVREAVEQVGELLASSLRRVQAGTQRGG
nr:TetR family transcriptional regulator C-terminal domain-containing protein [Georgenia sp. SYP-B2076]